MDTLNNTSSILSFFLGVFIMLTAFLLFFLFKNKDLKRAGLFLIGMLSIILIHLCTYLSFLTAFIYEIPHFLAISYPLLFLLGPLYYFFFKIYFDDAFKFKKIDILHLLPFIVVLVYHFPMFLESTTVKVEIIDFLYHRVPDEPLGFNVLFIDNLHAVLLCIYSFFAWRYIARIGKKLDVDVMYRLTLFVLIFAFIYVIVQTGLFYSGAGLIVSEISLFMVYGGLVFGITIYFLDLLFMIRPSKKYKTSSLTFDQMKQIELNLLKVLNEEKLFMKATIRIKDLAARLDIPTHHISQTLNEKMLQSFYDLINTYRVEEVKRKLRKGEAKRISIQAIGEECGFNNKTSFYRAFKKIEKTTPYNYLRQHV